jgi:4-hydroxyphenylpyruvate dioxygenase
MPTLQGFDHLEWWVGNARHAAQFFATTAGFRVVAHAGPETGVRDRVSYVLEQGGIRFVVTSALDPSSPVADHVRRHGDGVRDVAFAATEVVDAFDTVVGRGARPVTEPEKLEDDHGVVVRATVAAYGDTVHSFVDRSRYGGAFGPGYEPCTLVEPGGATGLRTIDHVVANVGWGECDDWVGWYADVFGFHELQRFTEDAIATEFSALRSTVVTDGDRVVLPVNEPAAGRRRSQIEEFLDYYGGPGVQHVAMRTDDIVGTVAAMRSRGMRCLDVPAAYYDEARERMGAAGADLDWRALAAEGVLVDRDDHGHLLQLFTENVAGRPTAFLEVIQRCGAQGFGEGNFKALFEAIEREQARRGNL